jgi:transcriptional regulator of arginine metabolism
MPSTNSRHRALRTALTEHTVSSQGELVDLLVARGFDVTQATVSRDLQAVGAVKVRDESGALRYTVTSAYGTAEEPETKLARLLGRYALAINVSGNLVVLNTPPGAAHVVAHAIDELRLAGTIGTIAGDDTLMIIADESTPGHAVAETLEQIGASA